MIWKPKAGQRVRLNYKNKALPHQGKTGTVAVCTPGRGGPVNALVLQGDGTLALCTKRRIGPINPLVRLDDGTLAIVPRGQLNAV